MTRRQMLALLAALPMRTPLAAQTRPTPRHRVILGDSHGLLLAPDGTLSPGRGIPESETVNRQRTRSALGTIVPSTFIRFTRWPICRTWLPRPAVLLICCARRWPALVLGLERRQRACLAPHRSPELEVTASWGPNSNTPVPLATKFDAVDVSSQESHVLALSPGRQRLRVGQRGQGPARHRTAAHHQVQNPHASRNDRTYRSRCAFPT